MTTALGAPAMTTKASAVGDPPAADPPAPGAAAASTSPSTMSGGGQEDRQLISVNSIPEHRIWRHQR